MTEKGYLTSGEAAQIVGVSKQTLLRAVKRGELKPIMKTPGGYLRFLPSEVKEYARQLSPRFDEVYVEGGEEAKAEQLVEAAQASGS